MKILHINCNYMDSWLHQKMLDKLESFNVINEVFVPLYCKEKHIVIPKDNVTVAVCFKKYDRLVYWLKQIKIYKRIKGLYNIKDFSLIHAYTVFTDGNIARKLAKKNGLPYVVAVRNTDLNFFFKYMIFLRKKGLRILMDASAIFFLSKSYQQQVLTKYVPEKNRKDILQKSILMPNGIDEFWLNNRCKKDICKVLEKFRSNIIDVLYVGIIDKNKNIDLTIEALDLLISKGWVVKYTVIGKVVDDEVYKKIREKKYVQYMEPQMPENLLLYYRSADLFVMPSFTESFGLVYAEAMSQGLPVIYTKNQGFDGQFADGDVGYAVSPLDSLDLLEKIEKCVENYRQLSVRAYEKVEKFDWKAICMEYKRIYFRIVNNNGEI